MNLVYRFEKINERENQQGAASEIGFALNDRIKFKIRGVRLINIYSLYASYMTEEKRSEGFNYNCKGGICMAYYPVKEQELIATQVPLDCKKKILEIYKDVLLRMNEDLGWEREEEIMLVCDQVEESFTQIKEEAKYVPLETLVYINEEFDEETKRLSERIGVAILHHLKLTDNVNLLKIRILHDDPGTPNIVVFQNLDHDGLDVCLPFEFKDFLPEKILPIRIVEMYRASLLEVAQEYDEGRNGEKFYKYRFGWEIQEGLITEIQKVCDLMIENLKK